MIDLKSLLTHFRRSPQSPPPPVLAHADYLDHYQYLPCLNPPKLQPHLDLFLRSPATKSAPLIVSLTSFPSRLSELPFCLYSLFHQTIKPALIVLWLAKSQFPHREKDLPSSVLLFQKKGLQISWCEDLKSYKKLIPTLLKYPHACIVTADDDIFYPPNWLELLYHSYLRQPNCAHAHRVHRLKIIDQKPAPYANWDYCLQDASRSAFNFATGSGGILYPPHFFHPDVTQKKLFQKLAPTADDIWFWLMTVLNHHQIQVVPHGYSQLIYLNPAREYGHHRQLTLSQVNVAKNRNDHQLQNVLTHYHLDLRQLFDSGDYWQQRYQTGGNSGAGSYGRLAAFKAQVVNDFVRNQQLQTVIEFGVGDGNQLSLLSFPHYLGFDVSADIIAKTSQKFATQSNYAFLTLDKFDHQQADLVLSLDVIFHLIEDQIYHQYLANLFSAAQKYVIIYSSNKNQYHCQHVRHRQFTTDIKKLYPHWQLIQTIPNPFPYDPQNPDHTSFCDFYIYKRRTTSHRKTAARLHPSLYQNSLPDYGLYLKHLFAYDYARRLLPTAQTILDYGCGDGYGAHYLAQKLPHCQIIATDIDQSALTAARKTYHRPNLTFLPFAQFTKRQAKLQFDLIVSFQVFEHLPDTNHYLQQLRALLQPSGLILISTPNRHYRLNRFQKPWNKFHRHEYQLSHFKKAITKVFPRAAFFALMTSNELLNLEYARVASCRRDKKPFRTLPATSSHPDKNDFSLADYYLSSCEFTLGLDLFALAQKPLS